MTVLGGILALYLFIAWGKGIHFFAESAQTYTILFDNVAGLKTNDKINVFGLPSGKVKSISLAQDGALVEIALNEEVSLFENASAEIRIKELTGGKMIELYPGNQGNKLNPGARIRGNTAMDFSTAFSQFGGMMQGISPGAMDSLFQSVKDVTRAVGELSREINTGELAGTVSDLSGAADKLNRILGQVEQKRLVTKVDSALVKMNDLADEAKLTMEDVRSISQGVKENSLPKADSLMGSLAEMLKQTEGLMVSVEELLAQSKDKNTLMGKVLYDEKFASDLDETVKNLNKTLEHLRTKRIHVSMTLSGKQKLYEEE
ncbi:MAG: MCE family protein [Bacteroidia bacterium]|nr:MCE family protein [Bacteroidia bacterium]